MEPSNDSSGPKVAAILLAATGVLMFSTKAVMVKLAYGYGVDPVSLLLLRMLFALPVFLLVGWLKGRRTFQEEPYTLKWKDHLTMIGLGFVGYYMASYFDFKGLTLISASLERLILFVYPTLVVVLSAVILGKRIRRQQLVAIGLTYLGMVVIFGNRITETSPSEDGFWLGSVLIFCSALTYAFYLMGSGEMVGKMGTVRFTTYAMVVSSICVIVHHLVFSEMSVFGLPMPVYGYALAMAIIATVIPAYIISEAIRRLGAPTVSIVGSLGPVSTISLSIIFLGETLLLNQVIGAVLVIIGVVWVSLKK